MLHISSRSRLYAMPLSIRKALIEKILLAETGPAISRWLQNQNIQITEKQTYRLTKPIKDRYGRLVLLGMPVKAIVENIELIEAKGLAAVEAELIENLEAKTGGIFAYQDNVEAKP